MINFISLMRCYSDYLVKVCRIIHYSSSVISALITWLLIVLDFYFKISCISSEFRKKFYLTLLAICLTIVLYFYCDKFSYRGLERHTPHTPPMHSHKFVRSEKTKRTGNYTIPLSIC